MQIDRIEETRLTAVDEAGIARLLARAFDTDFGGRSYYQQRHHVRLVARDPQIVGHMALAYRDIRMGEALVPVMGLAEVATDPDRRGEGIATRLMQAAIAEARATPAAFFLLFGDQPLYAASGFTRQSNHKTWIAMTDARMGAVSTGPSTHLMVLSLRDMVWDPDAHIDFLGPLF